MIGRIGVAVGVLALLGAGMWWRRTVNVPVGSLLRVELARSGVDTRVTLFADSGYKVNALLKPVLELPDGSIHEFDSPMVTADSAYFTSAPVLTLTGKRDTVHGLIRASVCSLGAQFCRAVVRRI